MTRTKLIIGEAIAGLALGALVGSLIGLSASPVVGSVLAALLALLGAFFGLGGGKPGARPPADPNPLHTVRVTCFALASLLAMLSGLYLRTGDRLSPSLEARQASWERLDFSKREAGQLVVLETLGLDLFGGGKSEAKASASVRSSLFNDQMKDCDALDPRQFASDDAWLAGLGDRSRSWRSVIDATTSLDPPSRLAVVQSVWRMRCPPS